MKRLIALFSIALTCGALADTVLLECEAFEDFGGWVHDSQFMDQMGSPYLLAHGLGRPVADAKTTFCAPAGRYVAWVRTKDWTAPWCGSDAAAGRFELVVNGHRLPEILGVQGRGAWLWTAAGEVELAAGANEVSLHDLTGFDGRCDAVAFVPAGGGTPDFDSLRQRQAEGVIPTRTDCDLVVVGGGIAGICTAVSAARLGLSVALVQDRPVLGGNNSSEVRVHLGAWQNMPPYPRLGDVLAEFGPRRGGNAQPAATYEDERKLAIVRAETNILLRLNERVCSLIGGVGPNGTNRIACVRSVNVRTGARTDYYARWFVDCTGDGTVGFLAGADWRMGREAKSETGEPWAPEQADMKTMGSSVQWRAQNRAAACAFPLEKWMIRLDDTNGQAEMKGDWDWEAGIGRDQIREAEYIRDYGLLVAYSNWAYVKNVSKKKESFETAELDWVAYVAGRRESRRLMGDFVLTERHVINRDYHEDGTAVATWTIDLHLPKTQEQSGFAGEPFRANSENETVWPYPIPYRCLYSRNVPNLFMAGRDISVTHIALGTVRLMRTLGMAGEVVGMAASVCKRHGCDPRAVYTDHLGELKDLMTKGVGDGRAYPLQMYNLQGSLDPRFRDWRKGNHQIREEKDSSH